MEIMTVQFFLTKSDVGSPVRLQDYQVLKRTSKQLKTLRPVGVKNIAVSLVALL